MKLQIALFRTIVASGLVFAGAAGPSWAATTDFDGTYAGDMALLPGSSNRCPPGRAVTLTVKDGKVPVSWRREPGEAEVMADGRFAGTVGGAKATGKITADKLEKDIGDGTCTYRWSLKRQP